MDEPAQPTARLRLPKKAASRHLRDCELVLPSHIVQSLAFDAFLHGEHQCQRTSLFAAMAPAT
jgi:hypothetical protein